jgi:hypothetical protein
MNIIKSSFLFLLFTFLLEINAECQKIFRDGYVIKKTGEALNGLVEYSSKQDVPSVCTFKRFDIARSVEYTPGQIIAFGYKNGNRYESREIDYKISFYEVIMTGKIILYRKGSKFYLDKDHLGFVELKNGQISYPSNGTSREFRNLAEFLGYITEGKTGNISEKFNLKNEIIPLITAYDKDSGKAYYLFNRKMSEDQFSQLTTSSGLGKNKFGLISGINVYMLNIKPLLKYYAPDPQPEISNITGITYERLLSRVTDKFSIRMEFLYYKQTFYCYDETTSSSNGDIVRNDVFFNFTGLKVPFLLQYSLTGQRTVPFFNAGLSYQFNINAKYTRTQEIENTLHEVRTYIYNDMSFRPSEICIVGGIGLRRKMVNRLIINLQGRVEVGSGIFTKLMNDNIHYSQISIQANFLAGITF